MAEKDLKCTSCNTSIKGIKGATTFKCPSCGKQEIIRCEHCRVIVARYKCPTCGFSGPN
ncbi:MAG: zinc finger domain-containing protein [Candidatus Nanoarchaeia archaeon]|nr:zinc finger domain-containing protein [Candidatus Nanoarchaeia archaeon]MDD5588042.1 zinc finger domain-containing protein [Candidatus Nanoarchaeia archaeon]